MSQSTATQIILVSTIKGRSPSMERRFGSAPLVLLTDGEGKGGWWGTARSRNAARFDSEADARGWLVRTFPHPQDRQCLTTMELRCARHADRLARLRDQREAALDACWAMGAPARAAVREALELDIPPGA